MNVNICLIQLLAWEADTRKHKKLLECKECPLKRDCEKRLEKMKAQGSRTEREK